ncbi:cytochrome c biogenesis protein CcsA [Candidatus Sulfurimonas marisnigri]|uniref:Cytochrome c biogenesis protein CcsA n=1 Tax=Candidatus Sulfurimonas marisnigri TaxID=2740405 RepID=A0A7S7M1C4_9BACT|nr:cytochrome c biogenesis protein CcsA [Candidatus Sulfurimonas marisnigri]QOY54439.1 cytochrome c biogenesis protein CcsA [Candidatus Sulfurimonas marisnigri]
MRFFLILLFFTTMLFSFVKDDVLKYQLDKGYAEVFSRLSVQSGDGRMKPLDTLNMDVLNKLTRKKELFGLNHNQVVLGMTFAPEFWKKVPMLEYNSKVQSYNDFYKDGIYTLMLEVAEANKKEASQRTAYDKELLKIDEKLQVAKYVYTQGYLKIFPLANDEKNSWLSPKTYEEKFSGSQKFDVQKILVLNKKALISGDVDLAKEMVKKIAEFQKLYGSKVLLTKEKVDAELFYNKILIFEKIYPFYIIVGLLLLVLSFIKVLREKNYMLIEKSANFILYGLFALYSFNLGLRWYISTHAPWTNAYESMIFIAWAILLVGLIFSKKSNFALGVTTFMAGVMLFAAHLSWIDPRITTLSSSLQSIWLVIHVAIISASYAFLALSFMLGIITLVLFKFSKNSLHVAKQIKESYKTNEASMIFGLSLLVIGTLLGSVWANESWGRVWAWDPKEAWSFISILVYMFILHFRFIAKRSGVYLFSVMSVLGFSTILMTYFGVNYFFDAIHVYASDSGSRVPWYAYIGALSLFGLVAISYKDRKNV